MEGGSGAAGGLEPAPGGGEPGFEKVEEGGEAENLEAGNLSFQQAGLRGGGRRGSGEGGGGIRSDAGKGPRMLEDQHAGAGGSRRRGGKGLVDFENGQDLAAAEGHAGEFLGSEGHGAEARAVQNFAHRGQRHSEVPGAKLERAVVHKKSGRRDPPVQAAGGAGQ